MTPPPWLAPAELGPCACSQLRRAARQVSALYDEALRSSGLTVTQYAVLVHIGRAGKLTRTSLAAQLGMDRTTLTRNLIPLEKCSLIAAAESADRRQRLIRLSAAGRRKLRQSFPLWENAQKRFASRLGAAQLKQLRASLAAAESAAKSA